MKETQLVYPMFALVLLSAFVLVLLFRRRVQAVRGGSVSVRYFALFQGEVEPEDTVKAARHFSNLFEAPTLYYAACITAMVTHNGSPGVITLAWLYVAARLVHAVIHLGANRLRYRIRIYFFSWIVLLALWIDVVVNAALHVSG
jgi:hypothetical protein